MHAFFASLHHYLSEHAYQNAELADFRQSVEFITGRDWQQWFEQWFLQPGHPELQINTDLADGNLYIHVRQQQQGQYQPLYHLPLHIELWYNGKPKRHKLQLTEQVQTFAIEVPRPPDLILYDPDFLLPGTLDFLRPTEHFIRQFRQSSSTLAQLEALEQLSTGMNELLIAELMLEALSHPRALF